MRRHLGYIPDTLIEYVLKKRIYSAFRVYIYLKYQWPNGCGEINGSWSEMASDLFITRRTLQSQITRLSDLGFLNRDKNGVYYVRGFAHIMRKVGLGGRRSTEVWQKCIQSNEDFIGYLMGAYLGQLSRKYCQAINYYSGPLEGGSHHEGRKGKFEKVLYKPMSISYLVSRTLIPHSTLQRWITMAVKHGYVQQRRVFTPMNVSADQLMIYGRHYRPIGGYLVTIGGKPYLNESSEYSVVLHSKRVSRN